MEGSKNICSFSIYWSLSVAHPTVPGGILWRGGPKVDPRTRRPHSAGYWIGAVCTKWIWQDRIRLCFCIESRTLRAGCFPPHRVLWLCNGKKMGIYINRIKWKSMFWKHIFTRDSNIRSSTSFLVLLVPVYSETHICYSSIYGDDMRRQHDSVGKQCNERYEVSTEPSRILKLRFAAIFLYY